MIRRIVLRASTLAAFVASIIVSINDIPGIVQLLVAGLAGGLLLWNAIQETVHEFTRRREFKGTQRKEKVRQYMIDMLQNADSCTMSSNDLSWATGDAEVVLRNLASTGSLSILMPQSTPLSETLRDLGAHIHYYGESTASFKSRFTIINPRQASAHVAIGWPGVSSHVVEIFENDDPALHLAKDLAHFVATVHPKAEAGNA